MTQETIKRFMDVVTEVAFEEITAFDQIKAKADELEKLAVEDLSLDTDSASAFRACIESRLTRMWDMKADPELFDADE